MSDEATLASYSERFTRAAMNERRRLEVRRDKLLDQAEQLDARIAQIRPFEGAPAPKDGKLRGKAIRDCAVRLLRENIGLYRQSDHERALIHYRDWLRLVEAHGYIVGGKRPESVFHNQITRHPQVRATTHSGYYELVEPAE